MEQLVSLLYRGITVLLSYAAAFVLVVIGQDSSIVRASRHLNLSVTSV